MQSPATTRPSSVRLHAIPGTTWTSSSDYATQTYAVELDGATLASGIAFCGNNFGNCNGAAVTSLGWALFDSFGGTGGNDLGVFDNFSIATVPEPATITLLGAGLLGLGLLRRRRHPALQRA
jgi:hypothetical protein